MLDGHDGGGRADLPREVWERAAQALLATAARSRVDLATFHEFVQRDEATQQRISVAPFQYVIFDFIERFPRCVLMLPPGCGKTNCSQSRTLWRVGNDPTRRCLYLTKDLGKAKEFVTPVKNMIESSRELRLVFPTLKPTGHRREPWTSLAITVDRPIGIKDPTLSGASELKGIAGKRLSDIMVDDVLDQTNTRTAEGRDKTWHQHEDVLTHRLDQAEGACDDVRMLVTNTAWHQDDYLHRLMDSDPTKYGEGWPALLIDIYGNVAVRNVPTESWDPPQLRPARCNLDANGCAVNAEGPFRVSAGDDAYARATGDDPDRAPLWWPRISHEMIEEKRTKHGMSQVAFNQAYLLRCRSEETAKCKVEWINACIERGRKEGHHSMVACSRSNPYRTQNPVVMGVDLAFGVGTAHDFNSLSTWEFLEDGSCKLLDMLTMQCANATFVRDLVVEKAAAFGDCQVVVESVSAQKIMRDILLERDRGIKVRAFNTTGSGSGMTNKWEQTTGVESLFVQVMNGAWILPCAPGGGVHPEVQRLIDACIYYIGAGTHTPDELMAAWFAIAWGRKLVSWHVAEKGSGKGTGLLGATTR